MNGAVFLVAVPADSPLGTTPAFTLNSSLQSPSGFFRTRPSYVVPAVSPACKSLWPDCGPSTSIHATSA